VGVDPICIRDHLPPNSGAGSDDTFEHMKVLLQDKKTGLFFVSEGSWTGARAEARDFKTSASAIWTAQQYNLQNAAVVFAFGSASNDVQVTIREETLAGMGAPARSARRGGAEGRLGEGGKQGRRTRIKPVLPDVLKEEGSRMSGEISGGTSGIK
jgi:hypothetical protein